MNEPNSNQANARAMLESRLTDMRHAIQIDPERSRAREAHFTESAILAVRHRACYDVELSWGGPSDWLRVFVEEDGDISEVEYHWADWGTHEEVKLSCSERDTLVAWIERYAQAEWRV